MRIVRWLALSKIHPNVLTFLGLVINIWAAWLFAAGNFRWAGVVVTGAAIFDMVDGRVARATSQVTRFGGFFDSVVDRYSDLALYIGLLVYYACINRFFYIVLTAIVMTGSVMVSYTRARAENAIPKCKVGFLERPERVVLIIIGALFDRMAAVLWVIAVLSNMTVIHRMIYTFQQAKLLEDAQLRLPAPPVIPGSILQNHVRHPQFRRVRDRERNVLHAQRIRQTGRPRRGTAAWVSRRQVGHFEILPRDAAPPARADGLHPRFLGGEARRVTLELVGLALHIGDFRRRVDASTNFSPKRSIDAWMRGTSARSTPVPTIISAPLPWW